MFRFIKSGYKTVFGARYLSVLTFPMSKFPVPPSIWTNSVKEVVQILDKLPRNHPWGFKTPYKESEVKTSIFNVISSKVNVMRLGLFVETSGNSSNLICGSRGIGKSFALRFAVQAIAARFPEVIPIYINYSGIGDSRYDDGTGKIPIPSNVLLQVLKKRFTDNGGGKSIESCLQILSRKDMFTFIVVDELERIYTSTQDERIRLHILEELAVLGSDISGRAVTILSGSDDHLPMLISKEAVHHDYMVRVYPLVTNAPSLNESKYPMFRVFSKDP